MIPPRALRAKNGARGRSRAAIRRRRERPQATLIVSAARKLEACRRRWREPGHDGRLDEALQYNHRVWTLIQIELAGAHRGLPPRLRSALVGLARRVDRLTFAALANPGLETLRSLIEVNRTVADGLELDADPAEPGPSKGPPCP